jgi:flagellar motor switch protein FliM
MDEKFLSQDEINALLEGVTGESQDGGQRPDTSEILTYNLATQERIVRGRMPSLELIHERFARLLRIGLYNLLRRNPEISINPIRNSKYSEFLRHLVVPTNFNLVKIAPLSGTAMIIMDPHLVFLLVDNLFGGNGKFQTRIEGRDFTHIELRIIQRCLTVVFDCFSKAWELVFPLNVEYVRSEISAQFANIATPNEVVVTTTFRIDLGEMGGDLIICMPYSMIEPIKDLLKSSLHSESISYDQRWPDYLKHQIQDVEVELVADLCSVESNLRQVLEMKAGDIIPISMPESVKVNVDYVPIMECSYGKLNGQYALQVENLIYHSDPTNSPFEEHPETATS